jgi:photosystem II stability/assembly factor-like uncharacterized protein
MKKNLFSIKMTYFIIIYIISSIYIIFGNKSYTKTTCEELKNTNKIINKLVYKRGDEKKQNLWRVLPIRSKEEYDNGMIGGEAEQHMHGIARCLTRPEFIYVSHDISGAWRSTDSGKTWQKTIDKGLYANKGQSIEVDPVNPNLVFLETDNSWNWLVKDYKGLYRSTDGGESWNLVLHTNTNYNPDIHRIYRHNITFDLTSINKQSALTWYTAFPNNGLFKSNDKGLSWSKSPISSLKGHSIVYCILTHPTDGKTVYIGTDKGFFISSSQGTNLKKSSNLPEGSVSSIAINLKNSLMIYVTIKDDGLYRSTDGGKIFSIIKKFDAARVFINPGYPEIIFLIGLNSNIIISHDAGNTWNDHLFDRTKTLPAPGLGRDSSWKSGIAGELSGIVPNPKDPNEAIAYSRATIWKTIDSGKSFKDSSTLFTGYSWSWSNSSVAFDPNNEQRIAFFNCDVGMTITNNGGKYFEQRNKNIYSWYKKGIITWIGTYAGTFQPVKNSRIIIASVGGYWKTQLMRSKDEGITWNLIDNLEVNENFFIAFNSKKTDIVYAGNKISHDSGEKFNNIDFGKYNSLKPSLFGMCNAHPNTVYAIDVKREYILRSDDACNNWRTYTRPGWKFIKLDSRPTFTADPVNPDKIYTLDKKGDLAVFNGDTWKFASLLKLAGGEKAGNFVRSIAIDPKKPEVVYAGTSASGISCIWRSTDSGKSWQDITNNFPRTGIGTMAVNPHSRELFIGSGHGTWIFPAPSQK